MPPSKISTSSIDFVDTESGSTVNPLYQRRSMRCYLVTASELHALSLANGIMAACFSISSFLFALGLDVAKDVAFGGANAESAKLFLNFIQPSCFIGSLLFIVAGFVAGWWRGSMLRLIKEESASAERSSVRTKT